MVPVPFELLHFLLVLAVGNLVYQLKNVAGSSYINSKRHWGKYLFWQIEKTVFSLVQDSVVRMVGNHLIIPGGTRSIDATGRREKVYTFGIAHLETKLENPLALWKELRHCTF